MTSVSEHSDASEDFDGFESEAASSASTDAQDPDSASDGDSDGDSEIEDEARNLFLAMEAAESGDSDDDDSDSNSDSASESDGDEDGDRHDAVLYDGLNLMSDSETESEPEEHFFPQFKRLPIELRHRIWEFFCPDLTAKARAYEFQIDEQRQGWQITPGHYLDEQTAPARAVLATHHESREFALRRAYKDTLSILGGRFDVRFNKENDLVLIANIRAGVDRQFPTREALSFPGFSDNIHHLACDFHRFSNALQRDLLSCSPNLVAAYVSIPYDCVGTCYLRSLISDKSHLYSKVVTSIVETSYPVSYCWPDVVKHRDHAEATIRGKDFTDAVQENLYNDGWAGLSRYNELTRENIEESLRELWPLVFFTDHDAHVCLDEIMLANKAGYPEDWNPGDYKPELEFTEDEYESSGIDDDPVEEEEEGSEDEDDLVVVDDSDSDSSSGSSSGSDREGGTLSPSNLVTNFMSGPRGRPDLDNESFPARFSSPEPEEDSATVRGSDDDDAESGSSDDDDMDHRGSAPARTSFMNMGRRKRVIASDSEDADSESDVASSTKNRHGRRGRPVINEETSPRGRKRALSESEGAEDESDSDEDDAPHVKKRARTNSATTTAKRENRRRMNAIVISDDSDSEDDSDNAPPQKPAPRRTVVQISDDEDSEDDEDEIISRQHMRRGRRGVRSSDSEEEEEDSDDDDEDIAVTRDRWGMTLAERLQLEQDVETTRDERGKSLAERLQLERDAEVTRDERGLSLAERLQLNRLRNPDPSDEDSDDDRSRGDEDSEVEEIGLDDYDARNYADFQDDEEGVGGYDSDGSDGGAMMGDEYEEDDYEEEY